MSVLWRLLVFARPFWRWIMLSVLIGFLTIGSSIALLATSAWIISRAALQPSIAVLHVAIAGVRFFGISRGIFRYLERYTAHEVTFRLLEKFRVWFYSRIEPLAPARLMQYHSGDLLSRIVGDIETLQDFYVRVLGPPLIALVTAVIMVIFMGVFDLLLAPVFLLFVLLVGVVLPWLVYVLSREPGHSEVLTRSSLNITLLDGIQGMTELMASGRMSDQQGRMQQTASQLNAEQRRLSMVTGLQNGLAALLVSLCVIALLTVAIPRVDPLYLAVLALAAMATFEAFLPLSVALQHISSNMTAAHRLFEIVDAEPSVKEPENPAPLPERYALEVRDLRFQYEPGEPVLENIKFSLPEGRRLAIVGPSGAGKTTIVNLLLRFQEYQQGEIQLAGRDIRRYQSDDLRQLIGVVSQHTHLFNTTIRENLLLARPDATDEMLLTAVSHAQLDDFIEALPDRFETRVGEAGMRLSGGERQRLAIARALLKDAPILLLDEATANLDAVTERAVMESIYTLMEGRTTLVITHRLSHLEAMDEIIVLKDGRFVERGTHAELAVAGGLYQRMLTLQNEMLVLP